VNIENIELSSKHGDDWKRKDYYYSNQGSEEHAVLSWPFSTSEIDTDALLELSVSEVKAVKGLADYERNKKWQFVGEDTNSSITSISTVSSLELSIFSEGNRVKSEPWLRDVHIYSDSQTNKMTEENGDRPVNLSRNTSHTVRTPLVEKEVSTIVYSESTEFETDPGNRAHSQTSEIYKSDSATDSKVSKILDERMTLVDCGKGHKSGALFVHEVEKPPSTYSGSSSSSTIQEGEATSKYRSKIYKARGNFV